MANFHSWSRPASSYDLLPPERRQARPASERLARPLDIEDADFVVIREPARAGEGRTAHPVKRTVRPGNDNGSPHGQTRAAPDASVVVVSVARIGLQRGERLLARLSDNMFSALVALAFIVVFLLSGGLSAVAGGNPAGYRPDPVAFSHVTLSPRTVNGMPMIVVSGILENHGTAPMLSPRLRANVFSGGYMLSSTLFNPRLGTIETGESRGFQVKLPHAGGKTPEIKLSVVE